MMEKNQSPKITESLLKIKSSKGPIRINNIQELIYLGLVAGDYSRPYLTDMGDTYIGL